MEEQLLQLINQFFDATGEMKDDKRVVKADLLAFRNWLETK